MRAPGPVCTSELGPEWNDAGTLVPGRSRPPVPLGMDHCARSQHGAVPGDWPLRSPHSTAPAAESRAPAQRAPSPAKRGKRAGEKSAARAFAFNQTVKDQARFRQGGKCACCGQRLDDVEEHAHHVVPNQSGSPGNPQHAWIASSDNCVILCHVCHERVHQDGRYREGAVAPASYYPYSHAGNAAAHQGWVNQLRDKERSVWS